MGPFQAGVSAQFNVGANRLRVIADTCHWTPLVPLTPLPLRTDAFRRCGRRSVRVPSGPRPRAVQFFGLFSWGRCSLSRYLPSLALLPHPLRELRPLVAVLPILQGHVGYCSVLDLRSSSALERSGLALPSHGRLLPGPPAQNPQLYSPSDFRMSQSPIFTRVRSLFFVCVHALSSDPLFTFSSWITAEIPPKSRTESPHFGFSFSRLFLSISFLFSKLRRLWGSAIAELLEVDFGGVTAPRRGLETTSEMTGAVGHAGRKCKPSRVCTLRQPYSRIQPVHFEEPRRPTLFRVSARG